MFDHMVALQDTAFEAIKPGQKCSHVDRAVRAYYDEHNLWDYWKHHVGHCIGLRYHEGPFLDIGDDTEIRPGMVFTVEPGLYAGGLGGLRHYDTIIVTDGRLGGIVIVIPHFRDGVAQLAFLHVSDGFGGVVIGRPLNSELERLAR